MRAIPLRVSKRIEADGYRTDYFTGRAYPNSFLGVALASLTFMISQATQPSRAVQDCVYGEALRLLTAEDAAGWFASCGHPVH